MPNKKDPKPTPDDKTTNNPAAGAEELIESDIP
jgi:hypothetical protein